MKCRYSTFPKGKTRNRGNTKQNTQPFIKTVSNVVEQIRTEQNITSVWTYFSENRYQPYGTTENKILRFNVTSCLSDALNGWLATRKQTGNQDNITHVQPNSVERDRKAANELARHILAVLKAGDDSSDDQVLQVLRKWGFEVNSTRVNVLPHGQSFAYSDNLGPITNRVSGVLEESVALLSFNC